MIKNILLFLLLPLFTCFGCQNQVSSEVSETALTFCESIYNMDYKEAAEVSTPSSLPYISFLASNITESLIEQIKKAGPATVVVNLTEMNEDESQATVVYTVSNSLKIDFINGTSEVIKEKQDTLRLKKEGSKWLVKMDIPQQSETQNPF